MYLLGYDAKYTDSKSWSNTCGIDQSRMFQIVRYFSCRTVYSYKHGSKTLSIQEGRPSWGLLGSVLSLSLPRGHADQTALQPRVDVGQWRDGSSVIYCTIFTSPHLTVLVILLS